MASQGAAHPYAAILTQTPFFTIPDINPASPISTQVEQIDQLNTLLLQSIDANFARVHQIITARILPEVKRFAIASEPTRKSAEFWRNFFSKAAGTGRIALPGEESEMTMTTLTSMTSDATQYHDHSMAVEGSFMSAFNPQGVSSTPLNRRMRDTSWDEDSIGSPYSRLDKRLEDSSSLENPSLPEGYSPTPGAAPYDFSTGTVETPDLPQYLKSDRQQPQDMSATTAFKSYAPSEASEASGVLGLKDYPPGETSVTTAFKNYPPSDTSHASTASVLRNYAPPEEPSVTTAFRNFNPEDLSPPSMQPPRSLEASRASSTTLSRSDMRARNADLSYDTEATPRPSATTQSSRPRPSTHLIDLTNTPPAHGARYRQPERPQEQRTRNLLEESEDDLARLGFSPPVSMKFPLPPRANAIYSEAAARTPARDREDATTRQIGDLLADITRSFSPSPMKMPDELMRRYSVMPPELAGGRMLFDSPAGSKADSPNIFAPSSDGNIFAPTSAAAGPSVPPTSAYGYGRGVPRRSVANTSFGSDIQTTEDSPVRVLDDFSGDDDDDSFDSGDDTVQLAAAQEAAAQGFQFADDSYLSDDASFAPHRAGFTDTHVHGSRDSASEVFGGVSGHRAGLFELHQKEDMSTFHGGRLEDAQLPGSPSAPSTGLESDISRLGLGDGSRR